MKDIERFNAQYVYNYLGNSMVVRYSDYEELELYNQNLLLQIKELEKEKNSSHKTL